MNHKTSIENFLKNKFKDEKHQLELLRSDNNVLYHGIKIENAVKGLKDGVLEPRTTQRYWDDGRCLRDDNPDYNKSGWMYGWSTSRDRFLASTFGGVLMVFDRDKEGRF